MPKILFLCEHNSARSQMAEAYLNHLGNGKLVAESAGLEPGTLNPRVVAVLKEDGIDISGKSTVGVFELFKSGRQFDAVIAVCSAAVSARCPIFPGRVLRRNWPFEDPSRLTGSEEEILAQLRLIRDQIRDKVSEFIKEFEEQGLKIFIQGSHS
jgi:arsenate reductase (thioredoxin)